MNKKNEKNIDRHFVARKNRNFARWRRRKLSNYFFNCRGRANVWKYTTLCNGSHMSSGSQLIY